MTVRSSILLVSTNPELHRILELIASTCNFTLHGTESPKNGIGLLMSEGPACAIFDLETLPHPRQKIVAKRKLSESGVPVLFLNDSDNGTPRPNGRTPLRIEPIVKFVMEHSEKGGRNSNNGLRGKLRSLFGFTRD